MERHPWLRVIFLTFYDRCVCLDKLIEMQKFRTRLTTQIDKIDLDCVASISSHSVQTTMKKQWNNGRLFTIAYLQVTKRINSFYLNGKLEVASLKPSFSRSIQGEI